MAGYNRYVPQQDGSYRKNTVPQPIQQLTQAPPPEPPPRRPPDTEPPRQPQDSVGAFLRRLIPRNFDTGDLIVVLLLLLMASDSEEEHNTALLTLVLYLFL